MNRFRFPRGLALLCAGVMLVSLAGCSPAADPAIPSRNPPFPKKASLPRRIR